jgi:RNA polymerase sigma-70 factor (ECF subfamily)
MVVDSRELVERLRTGDEAAFDAVYECHRARLFSYLVRSCGERAAAEELLQETWLRFARFARDLAPDTDLRAWLFTVARNLQRSRRRREYLGRELLRQLGFLAPVASSDSPFERALASETEQRLEAALAALPLKYREILLLALVEGLSLSQVAAVLGLKAAAVRQRLSRARGMLSSRLDREFGSSRAAGVTR